MSLFRKIAVFPVSIVYALIIKVRHLLFDYGILKSERFDVPIIGVGNLSLGGTGKSPLVIYLIGLLQTSGKRVGVVSRGYGRVTKGVFISNSKTSASEIGDELFMIKERFPGLAIIAAEKRVEGVKSIMSSEDPPEIIILDDCFQHRYIKPSLMLLTTTHLNPFWNDMVLPSGNLRDVKSAAKRADAIVVTKCPDFSGSLHLPSSISGKEIFKSKIGQTQLEPITGKTNLKQGDSVIIFSALARNKDFKETVENRFKVFKHFQFRDHHPYTESEITKIISLSNRTKGKPKAIITTEKDLARLTKDQFELFRSSSLFVLKLDIEFEKQKEFDTFILDRV